VLSPDVRRKLWDDPNLPRGLQFVVYGSSWIHRGQQFFCIPMPNIDEKARKLMDELNRTCARKAVSDALRGQG